MATGYCPSDCADDALVPNLPVDCEPQIRKIGIDRFGFFSCGIDLPDPMNCAALEALVDQNQLVFSSPLRNVVVNDPEFEDFILADCLPADRIVTRRVIDFQDVIAVANTTPTSPLFSDDLFHDRTFWRDKQARKYTLRVLFVMCDGTIEVPRDDNGNPMQLSLDVFRSLEAQNAGSANQYTLEIKKGRLEFKGDPIQLVAPELDADGNVFNINDCDINL